MLVMKKLERIRRFYIKMQQDHYLDPLNPEIELMLPFFFFFGVSHYHHYQIHQEIL